MAAGNNFDVTIGRLRPLVFELRPVTPDTRRFEVTGCPTEAEAVAAPGEVDPPDGVRRGPGYGLVRTSAVLDGGTAWIVTYHFGRPRREDPRDAFLKAIIDAPDADLPRLVYADWLDERGDPRGQFIRVQCELAKCRDGVESCPPVEPRCGRCTGCELRRREMELLAAHGMAWLGSAPTREDAHPLAWTEGDGTVRPVRLIFQPEFHRGFVEAIACTAADFARHAAAILAAAPLRRVTLDGPADRHVLITTVDSGTSTTIIRGGGCEVRLVAPDTCAGLPARLEAGDQVVRVTDVIWRTGGRVRDLTLRGSAGQRLRAGRGELFAEMTLELAGPVMPGAGIPAR